MLKKIVILGPESTGKTSLSEQLASHYQTIWCPEFAREYLLKHGMDYSYDDLLIIAKGQIALEEGMESRVKSQESGVGSRESGVESRESGVKGSKEMLFIDTDMYVMKVWCEFVFGKCHKYILDQIATRKYDLYLLCNIDLQWTKDELREYPDLESRQKLFKMYFDILVNQETPWVVISGNEQQRLEMAVKAVDQMGWSHSSQ